MSEEPFLVKLKSNPFSDLEMTKEEKELLKYYKRAISNEYLKKSSVQRMRDIERSLGEQNVDKLLNSLLIFDGNFSDKMNFID